AAVAARRARAAVKADIASRTRSALEVARDAWDGEPVAGGMRVRELLGSIPGLGPTRVAKAMDELGIAASKKVAGLGRRQRPALPEWLYRGESARHDRRGRLVVLAGPTAVGKGTVSSFIRENHPDTHLSVSATTRSPRPGEVDGVNYFFVSDEEFDRLERS